MPLDRNSLAALGEALRKLEDGFSALPQAESAAPGIARLEQVLSVTAERLRDNFPYFHPLYAGQMLKPPHPVARLAYALALWINPNNHALDGGRATSAMEKEAVAEIASMFGWRQFLGHLCGGGTMANLEALWVAGQVHPRKTILASDQAHYTHRRISSVLGLPFDSVPTDSRGRMDLEALDTRLKGGDVGTVVATMGTTAVGSVDALADILDLREKYGFRLHVDAAYGGYFTLAQNLAEDTARAFACLGQADSLVTDPHKHGLQPYGCGCILFRDPAVGKLYKHDSPYTYFSSSELHLGEISLECSRPGAAAAALWATQRLLPLSKGGEFAQGLERCRKAALDLHGKVQQDPQFVAAFEPELDILVWVPQGESVAQISTHSRAIFLAAANRGLHLALAEVPVKFFPALGSDRPTTLQTVTALRSVLMKPEHLDWVGRIWIILQAATAESRKDPAR